MAYAPTSFAALNYRDYSTWWLKAYEPSTTTPKAMATDATGDTTLVKAELNADGFPVTAGDAIFIPFIDGSYDLWLFPTETDADNNNTSEALRLADDLTGGFNDDVLGQALIADLSQTYIFSTVAEYKTSTIEFPIGKIIYLLDRQAKFEIISGTGTGNDTYIIASDTVSQSAVIENTEEITLRSLGVDYTGAVDATAIIQLGADYCTTNDNKLVSSGGTIKVSGQTLNLRRIKINLDSTFDFGTDTTGFITLGGNSNSVNNPRQYIRNVVADVNRLIDEPLVKIIGAKDQLIEIEQAYAVELYARNRDYDEEYSIGYCRFRFQYVSSIRLKGETQGTSAQGGWINENQFELGRTREVVIGDADTDTYRHNHNHFFAGAFEGSGRKIEIQRGAMNSFHHLRFESIDDDSIIFGDEAINNRLYVSWVSSQSAEPLYTLPYLDTGRNNMVSAEDDGLYDVSPAVFLSADTLKLDNDSSPTYSNIWGVGNWDGLDEDDVQRLGALDTTISGDKIEIPANKTVVRTPKTPVSDTGDTWITLGTDGWATGYRADIWGYDIDGNLLSTTASDIYVTGQGEKSFGAITTGDRTAGERIQVTNPDCRFVVVAIRCGSTADSFDWVALSFKNPKAASRINGGQLRQQASYAVPFNTPNGLTDSKYMYTESGDNSVAFTHVLKVPVTSSLTITATSTNNTSGATILHAARQSVINLGNATAEIFELNIGDTPAQGGSITITGAVVSGEWEITITRPVGGTAGAVTDSIIAECAQGFIK